MRIYETGILNLNIFTKFHSEFGAFGYNIRKNMPPQQNKKQWQIIWPRTMNDIVEVCTLLYIE